jgi:AraC-like DNA-binding protein
MLFNYVDDVKIVSSFHKKGKPYGKNESRLSHGFIFRQKGSASYFFKDKTYTVSENSFIFLPKGSFYEYVNHNTEDSLYTSINFQATITEPTVSVYPIDVFHSTSYLMQNFSELWNFGTVSDKYNCLSLLYDLLSHISTFEHLKNEDKRKQELISPAIEYLKKHLYEENLKIDNLHRLCGISDTYFRRIFSQRFGMNPQSYVSTERITHAKSIIESGDYDDIKEISESVGYSDPLYFSKAFKKNYGMSPSAYEKMLTEK